MTIMLLHCFDCNDETPIRSTSACWHGARFAAPAELMTVSLVVGIVLDDLNGGELPGQRRGGAVAGSP